MTALIAVFLASSSNLRGDGSQRELDMQFAVQHVGTCW
jgi:hypothetical protein